MSKLSFTALVCASLVMADVRMDPNQKDMARGTVFRIPSTFGYQKLVQQKQNNNDQFLRSNIDNEANQRNERTEAPRDMLPCRQEAKGVVRQLQRGVPVELPLRWNNPHDSSCEVNVFVNGMTQVAPIKRPFHCGGGYQDAKTTFTIPLDFPGCSTEADNCVIQVYGHSVEPRTYAMCVDFVLTGAPQAASLSFAGNSTDRLSVLSRRQAAAVGADVRTTQFQAAIHYWDSFDTSHVDSTHSGYRGQQAQFVRDEVMAAVQLQSYVGNGGLVPLGNIDAKKTQAMRNRVQAAIKKAEREAIRSNKAAQAALDRNAPRGQPKTCFEGALYGVVNNANCNRQFTNTYVTNVGYRQIFNTFLPQFQAAGLTPYSPMLKSTAGVTPVDPYGAFESRNKKPSLVPQGQGNGGAVQAPPAQGQQCPQPAVGAITPGQPLSPALPSDSQSGPKEQGGAGIATAFDNIGPKRRDAGRAPEAPQVVQPPPAPAKEDVNPDDQVAVKNNEKNAVVLPDAAQTVNIPVPPVDPVPAVSSSAASVIPAPTIVGAPDVSSTVSAVATTVVSATTSAAPVATSVAGVTSSPAEASSTSEPLVMATINTQYRAPDASATALPAPTDAASYTNTAAAPVSSVDPNQPPTPEEILSSSMGLKASLGLAIIFGSLAL